MKIIIAGGRTLNVSNEYIQSIIDDEKLVPTEIVSGASGRPENETKIPRYANGLILYANGIDGCGEKWADSKALPITRFPAKFTSLGRPAGPIRNAQMAEYADILILIWDGKSPGSASMRREMKKQNKRIVERIR